MEKLTVVEARRSRLREWIAQYHNGVLAGFAAVTEINQGELSGLLRNKSFGEKKARSIEKKAGMPTGWLDAAASVTTEPPTVHDEALRQVIKLSRTVDRIAKDLSAALQALTAEIKQEPVQEQQKQAKDRVTRSSAEVAPIYSSPQKAADKKHKK